LGTAFGKAYSTAGTDLQSFLAGFNPAWTLVGRVHFNLAENRRDPDYPFAFMATYTTGLSAGAGPVSAVGRGPAPICRGEEQKRTFVAAPAGQTRRGNMRLAEADGRRR
jgi:hypothetical protein